MCILRHVFEARYLTIRYDLLSVPVWNRLVVIAEFDFSYLSSLTIAASVARGAIKSVIGLAEVGE